MNVEIMREFFGWMTLINLALYIWTAAACVFMKGCLSKMVEKLFGVGADAGKAVTYGYVGAYKLLFIVFSLVPWLALTIMTK